MKNRKNFILATLTLLIITFWLSSCISDDDNFTAPKPRAYMRIELPNHEYQKFDLPYPFSFEYSKHSEIYPDTSRSAEPYWFNIYYPSLGVTIFVTHKKVKNNLEEYIEDAIRFANKHIPKADDLLEDIVLDNENMVFGKIYNIEGSDVASPCQFWVHDSTKNFLRGSMYFDTHANNDSLQPVIDYIRDDVLQLINTFEWKN